MSTSSGAHGRDASTKSSHSIEEQSAPAVKRKCICEHQEIQDTPECRVFREHYDRLVNAIQDPLSLATQLLIQGIITSAVKERMSEEGLPTVDKNSTLLSAVQKQVQLESLSFYVFLSALKEDPSVQLVVDSMQSKWFIVLSQTAFCQCGLGTRLSASYVKA